MAAGKNPIVRVVLPLAILIGIGGFTWFAFNGSNPPKPPSQPSTPPASTPATTPAVVDPAKTAPPSATVPPPAAPAGSTAATTPPALNTPPSAPVTPPAPVANAAPLVGLKAKAPAGQTSKFAPLGSLETDPTKVNPFVMQLVVSEFGAGVESIKLSKHFDAIGKNALHETIQRQEKPAATVNAIPTVPFAAVALFVNGQIVDVSRDNMWAQIATKATPTEQSLSLQTEITDAAGALVARVTRTFTLRAARYDVELDQRIENLSSQALRVQWVQLGPSDLPIGVIRYGGDPRRLRFGYINPESINPGLAVVNSGEFLIPHQTMLGSPDPSTGRWLENKLWPNDQASKEDLKLSWAALTNRYFAVSVHPLFDKQPNLPSGHADKRLHAEKIDRLVVSLGGGPDLASYMKNAVNMLRIFSDSVTIAPGGAPASFGVGIYAGPLSRSYLGAQEQTKSVGLDGLVVYTFGGPCGFCTFQPIARFLRWFLGFLHDHVLFDWALAIVMLVVCVRTILHPITKWSQTSLQRFSKQMAAIAPKQKKLQEKYGSDQKKLREEMAILMREEKVNYAGALGCLPMFLQTPIWIALSAMIYFTFEFRHEPAFFGLIQKIAPNWSFLADLSEPDKLVSFGSGFSIPLLSGFMGEIDGLNLLPLLMGVLFYAQQKYLTPPPTAEVSPEMQTQQKIMKFMIVVLFPLMMYNAPSALVLYFLANSGLGIIESQMIRKQMNLQDAKEEERKKLVKEGKIAPLPEKEGFFARLRRLAEEKQKMVQQQQRRGRAGPKR